MEFREQTIGSIDIYKYSRYRNRVEFRDIIFHTTFDRNLVDIGTEWNLELDEINRYSTGKE